MRRRKKTAPSLRGRKKRKKKPYLVDCLQLPTDAVMGMEQASICGDRELTFRCFKGISRVSGSEIILQAKRHNIRIRGECLALSYYTFEEVKICGRIESIVYEKRG